MSLPPERPPEAKPPPDESAAAGPRPKVFFEGLGGVIGNLMALEVVARAAVSKLSHEQKDRLDITKLRPGEMVEERALTDYKSLGPLLSAYNNLVAPADQVDAARLVGVRDAICHGRAVAGVNDGYMTLVKFGRPYDGKVRVERCEVLDETWFKQTQGLVRTAALRIYRQTDSPETLF